MNSQKDIIEERVAEWLIADVGTLSSFANMESLLKREYYGRFIIELIQNARDAWYASDIKMQKKSVVRVILHGDQAHPVLTVCNQGVSFNAEKVLKHITQFGESSKASGEGIGHKGIGFKSVLEITRTPEIYSRDDTETPFTLRVSFDPSKSEHLLNHSHTKPWAQLVSEYDPKGIKNKDQRLPILRFPQWIEQPSELVEEEAVWEGVKFNTLIRLPYDPAYDSILEITKERWLMTVETAMDGVTDEIVMLLDAFDQVILENRFKGKVTCITAITEANRELTDGYTTCRLVTIERNKTENSKWLLYKQHLDESDVANLAQEITVGIKCINCNGRLIPQLPEPHSCCFHLFFPTSIDSKLPFLFHAYFEVDAGRTRFAQDAKDINARLLNHLRGLLICTINDLITMDANGGFVISKLPSLFRATAATPDDVQAKDFRDKLLADLDELPWVEVEAVDSRCAVKPAELLLHKRPDISMCLAEIFSPSYAMQQSQRYIPHHDLGPEGLEFIAGRLGDNVLSLETLISLLSPGQNKIWIDHENEMFVKLLKLIPILYAQEQPGMSELIKTLRGSELSRFIPTPTNESGITFVPLPSESGRGKGKTDLAVFARLTQKSDITLEPPECLKIAFVQDGILSEDMLKGPGRLLGIREYTVMSILDRLNTDSYPVDTKGVLNFVWQLLLKEDVGSYGIKSVVKMFDTFSPGTWWWYRPDSAGTDADKDEQRRTRALNNIQLPAKSGMWVSAEKLVFGKAWAEQLTRLPDLGGNTAKIQRSETFSDLEELAPSNDSIIADPDVFFEMIQLPPIEWSEKDNISLPNLEADRKLLLLFCFLQRLGVWELLPVEAYVDYTVRKPNDPWHEHTLRASQWVAIKSSRSTFHTYYGTGHENVYVAEDFNWLWPLTDNTGFVRLLARGCAFYSKLVKIKLFCSGCKTHGSTYRNSDDDFQPSLLLWRIMKEKWLLCAIGDGELTTYSPSDAWWESNIPEPSRIQTSPLRFLPMPRDISAAIAQLCRMKRLESVCVNEISQLLLMLRNNYNERTLMESVSQDSSFRQAFIGLHQRLYSRLRQIGKKEAAYECIVKVGLLCEQGGLFIWHNPAECRYDDGKFSAYKNNFVKDLPFCVLSRSDEDSATATFLQLPLFEVTVKRSGGGLEKDVTTLFSIIGERLAHLFSILVYYKIGSFPLTIDGKDFPTRLRRIKNLRIYQVEDLHLELSAVGTIFSKTIGKGINGDLYLDWTTHSHPIIYHDFTEQNWPELLCPRIAPFVAQLVENIAYSDAISLLYQCEYEDLPYFLIERGISDNELDTIRAVLGQSDDVLCKQAQVWWTAVLELFSISHQPLQSKDLFFEVTSILRNSGLPQELTSQLLQFPDVEHAREDSEGILRIIESAGYSLESLNSLLQKNKDRGLSLQKAKQLRSGWLSRYEKELAYTLTKLGLSEDRAKKAGSNWAIPTTLSFRTQISVYDVLLPLASILNGLVNNPEKQFCAKELSVNPLQHFSDLCNVSQLELADKCKMLYNEEEQKRISKSNFTELKRRLALIITALRTTFASPSYKIREMHQTVMNALSLCLDVNTLYSAIPSMCGEESPVLVSYVRHLFDCDRFLSIPEQADMYKSLENVIDHRHLVKVQNVLNQTNRLKVDKIRKQIIELNDASIDLKPYQGSNSTPLRKNTDLAKKITSHHVQPKNQRQLNKMGSDAEYWVLAALLNQFEQLWKISFDEFRLALEKLADVLACHYHGDSIQKLLSFKDRALLVEAEDDDRMEALSDFIHLSKESDSFGCDILGWLSPFEGSSPQPMFLEVKSDADRKFNVSENEWMQAERLAENYAFMVVLRGAKNTPAGFELLPNPHQLANAGVEKLTVVPDGRIVSYMRSNPQQEA